MGDCNLPRFHDHVNNNTPNSSIPFLFDFCDSIQLSQFSQDIKYGRQTT